MNADSLETMAINKHDATTLLTRGRSSSAQNPHSTGTSSPNPSDGGRSLLRLEMLEELRRCDGTNGWEVDEGESSSSWDSLELLGDEVDSLE